MVQINLTNRRREATPGSPRGSGNKRGGGLRRCCLDSLDGELSV